MRETTVASLAGPEFPFSVSAVQRVWSSRVDIAGSEITRRIGGDGGGQARVREKQLENAFGCGVYANGGAARVSGPHSDPLRDFLLDFLSQHMLLRPGPADAAYDDDSQLQT